MARAGTLEIKLLGDEKDLKRALGRAESSLEKFATGAVASIAAIGVAGGAALVGGFAKAMERDQIQDRLQAQLDLTADEAEKAGEIAGDLWANAYAESVGEAGTVVDAVMSTFGTELPADQIEQLSQHALDMAGIFDVDVQEGINAAGVAMRTGLAEDGVEAFDLLFASMQKVPAQMRDELIPIVEEYAQDFGALGISGAEAFGILVDASQDGRFELDKTADAIKEFGVLTRESSDQAEVAFTEIGLDAEAMTAKLVSGGADAREALDDTIAALLEIEDPAEVARLAVELFGEPINDLNTTEVPEFLRRLSDMDVALEGSAGKASEAGASFNDNLGTKLTTLKNTAMNNFIEFVHNNFLDEIDSLITAFEEDGLGGAIDRAIELWEQAQPHIEEWFNGTFMPFWNETVMPVMAQVGSAMGQALVDGLVNFLSTWLEAEIREEIEDLNNLLPSGLQIEVGTGGAPSRPGNPLPYVPPGGSTPAANPLVPSNVFHSGGVAQRGGLAVLADKERVLSPQQTASFDRLVQQLERGGVGGGVTVNMPAGSDGDDVVRALQRWTRRNGPLPVQSSG